MSESQRPGPFERGSSPRWAIVVGIVICVAVVVVLIVVAIVLVNFITNGPQTAAALGAAVSLL